MSVKYYEWGVAKGGSTPGGGGSAPADAAFGPPEQFGGVAVVAPTTITFTRDTKWVHVINSDVEFDLEVSLDGGANYISLSSGSELQEAAQVASLLVRGYEISAGLTAA